MKINGKILNEKEIIAETMINENAWNDFSMECIFSMEEIMKYHKNINWSLYSHNFFNCNKKSDIYSDRDKRTVLELVIENDYLKDHKYTLLAFCKAVKIDKEFIIKYKDKLPQSIVFCSNDIKFTKSEIVKEKLIKIPEVGEQITVCCGSDSYPYEIIDVSKSKQKLIIRRMQATPIKDGFDYYNNQEYIYSSDEKGEISESKLTIFGYYKTMLGRVHRAGARYYQDPTF